MEIKINKESKKRKYILELLKSIVSLTPSKIEDKGHIYIKATDKLEIRGTDNLIEIWATISKDDIEIVKEGEVLVNARKLYMLLKEMNEDVVLKKGKTLSIKGNKSSFRLPLIESKAYNRLKNEGGADPACSFNIKSDVFLDMLNKVSVFVGKDDDEFVLNGICFHIEDKLKMISTNRSHLLYASGSISDKEAKDKKPKYMIPEKSSRRIKDILKLEDVENINISFYGGNICVFKCKNIMFISRLLNCKFPPYDKMIDKEYKIKVSVEVDKLKDAVKQTTIMVDNLFSPIWLNIFREEIIVSTDDKNPNYGSINILCNRQEGEDLLIRIGGDALLKFLKVIDQKDIVLCFNSDKDFYSVKMKDWEYIGTPLIPLE